MVKAGVWKASRGVRKLQFYDPNYYKKDEDDKEVGET